LSNIATPKAAALDVVNDLSDRELSEATFLIVCALAERLTGQIPCLLTPNNPGEPPNLIHGLAVGWGGHLGAGLSRLRSRRFD
jgi:hypothetical protein